MPNSYSAPAHEPALTTLGDDDLLEIICQAFDRAIGIAVGDPDLGIANRKRSGNWVKCLRDEFRKAYRDDDRVRALCLGCKDNRAEFKRDELLHDVLVCRMAKTKSRKHRTPLPYVSKVLWQVESEFANNGRAAVNDFTKLILGSAARKLFVGPLTLQR